MIFNKDNKCDLILGQLCISKAGRDKGKVFIVYEVVDEDYVLLVNGKERKIENPKKKKIKHLQKINEEIEGFSELKKTQNFNNSLIRKLIKTKIQEEA